MNRGRRALNQLQTRYQLVCLVEIHRLHVGASRIHLPDIVFGDLNRVVDQCPEQRNFLGQIGTEVRANGLNGELCADALNTILLATLQIQRQLSWVSLNRFRRCQTIN